MVVGDGCMVVLDWTWGSTAMNVPVLLFSYLMEAG